MMSNLLIMSTTMILAGLTSFVLNYTHLLNSLLSLEMLSVSLYMMVGLIFAFIGVELFYLLYLLIMIISEGVLGLSLLITMVHCYSEDFLKTYNLVTC